MTDQRIDTLKTCYTGVIHDVMRATGFRNFTLPPRITPLQPEMTLCGPVFTIEGRLDEAADPHQTLLAWTGLLSKCKPGHIWTAQPHTHILAQMGELSAARQALDGAHVAPGTQATLRALTDPEKRPPTARQELSDEIQHSEPAEPFELNVLEFFVVPPHCKTGSCSRAFGYVSSPFWRARPIPKSSLI